MRVIARYSDSGYYADDVYDSYQSLLFVEIKNATILHMFSCMHILLCR